MRKVVTLTFVCFLLLGAAGCSSMSKQEKGAIIGAASGAVVGGVVGKQAGNTAVGAIIGAAVGGAAGAIIGNYMDDQAEEMRQDLEGAEIERVGEGIKVTFGSGILFDVDRSELRQEAKDSITKLATILNKYEDTNILIEGHTDSDGAEDYNLSLSERRAKSVSVFLAEMNVATPRVTTFGYGEAQPVADNATLDGKQANRRVEVAIMANDKLKKAAEDQAAQG